ncbi:hypothetical protein CAURIC_10930 [Corynebacterium auriscanis]|nr:hypothetical protein CAURIC_10930 [Corynebacterium auriscanis]
MLWFEVSFRSALRGCAVQGWAVGVGRCGVGGACGSVFSTWSVGWWGVGVEKQNEMRDVAVCRVVSFCFAGLCGTGLGGRGGKVRCWGCVSFCFFDVERGVEEVRE